MKKETVELMAKELVEAGHVWERGTVELPCGIFQYYIKKIKHTELKKSV